MNHSSQLTLDTDPRAEVLASPAYQERVGLLFDLFRASRQRSGDPQSLLSLQAALGEILRGWQQKKREFKNEDNPLGIAVVNRLIQVLKRIADSIAWRTLGYDRLLIQLLAEHSKTGFLEKTIIAEFQIADQIIKDKGATVLVNDLTTILRHGDLTVIHPDTSLEIVEVKTGRKDGRATRQKKHLKELLDFLNTGTRISKEGTRDYIRRIDIPIQTHHSVVGDLIDRARDTGYERLVISDCLAVEVVYMQHPNAHKPPQRPFADVEHVLSSTNLDVFDKPTPRLVPYGVFPFDDATCYDLITGSIYLIATLNFDALIDLFNEFGLALQLPQPSQQEIEEYLSASIAEIRKAQKERKDRHNWFVITAGSEYLRMSPDTWGAISLEFIRERTFAESQRQLMSQFDTLDASENRLERLYWGYKSEVGVWS